MQTSGFSLIELLVVMAIIGILTTIAVPTYSDYVIKAKASELLMLANAYKLDILEDSLINDAETFATKSLTANSDNITSVNLTKQNIQNTPTYILNINSKIQTSFNEPIQMQFQGALTGNSLEWHCAAEAKFHKYLPKSCQNHELL